MLVQIIDSKALKRISPQLLAAYAVSVGWSKDRTYRSRSHIYIHEGGDEIIIPDTPHLADYASVVSQLINIFSEYAGSDQLAVYRELLSANRDVIRVRAENGKNDSTVPVGTGVKLVEMARDMIWTVACSLGTREPHYARPENSEAANYMSQVRLGQTEPGGFVVALLSPVLESTVRATEKADPDQFPRRDPMGRQVTRRLSEALSATETALKLAEEGENASFPEAVNQGVTAGLCETLAGLVKLTRAIEVSLTCARTLPSEIERTKFRFTTPDHEILDEAARRYREQQPRSKPKSRLTGFVRKLERSEGHSDGKAVLQTTVDGRQRSVEVQLGEADYDRAIDAHRENSQAVIEGDFESTQGQAFLSSACLLNVIDKH